MFSKGLELLKRTARTAGFRLGAWHLAVFLAGNLLVLGLAYFMLSASLQSKERTEILDELQELGAKYKEGGISSLRDEARQDAVGGGNWFFVRFTDPEGNSADISTLKGGMAYDTGGIGRPAISGTTRWDSLPSRSGDEDRLEVATRQFHDGSILSVGRDTSGREAFLERFSHTSIAILFPAALLGLLASVFLTREALSPLRHLADTVREIESGNLDSRVCLRDTGDELDDLGRLFNLMLERISLLVSGMRDALDNVAHDLRTPLTRLRAMAEDGLRPEKTPQERGEALSDCLEESERVLQLLNALIDISEAETGTMKLRLERHNLAAITAKVTNVYSYLAEAKKIRFSSSGADEITLLCDRDRFSQAVANLLDNAVKYTPPGGEVRLETGLDGEGPFVMVSDTGPGIPEAELPRIWERLYRGDSSRSEKGMGLGLSLVRAVMKAHGGRVEVSSSAGGSVFKLRFPPV